MQLASAPRAPAHLRLVLELPKLAECFRQRQSRCVDQHQAAPPETEMVSSLDRNSVNEKIPTNTIPQSEGILKSQSQAESTTINDVDPGIKYKI